MRDLLATYPAPDEQSVKAFLSDKQREGMSSGSIANYVKAYRSFFKYISDRGLHDYDAARLKQPRIKYKERRVPKDEDVQQLLRTVTDAEDAVALCLLVDCGLRVTELATIKIDSIDFNESSILIDGKGGKRRTVYMSESVATRVREHAKTISGEYLFPETRADGKSPHRGRRYIERRLEELCERAGVERLTPHQLRHYFATHALSNGADVKAVSEFLGHADVTITLKIYHHVDERSIRRMHREYSPLKDLC